MRKLNKLLILTVAIILLCGSLLSVQASSFQFNAVAKKEQVSIGDTVKIDIEVSNINVQEGINVIEADLEYDNTIFESVTFINTNKWIANYHEEERKFIIIKLVEGVTEAERIGQIQLKLKDDLKGEMETEIRINRVTSNNGTELINEGNRIIKIKVVKKQQNGELKEEDQEPENKPNEEENQEPENKPNEEENQEPENKPNEEKNQESDNKQNEGQNEGQNQRTDNEQKQEENQERTEDISQKNKYIQNKTKTKEELMATDNLPYTGYRVGFLVIMAIVLIGINFVYFILKIKSLQEEGTDKYRKRMLLSSIALVVLMMIVIFLAKDVIAFTEDEIKEAIEILKRENEDNPESIEYLVTDEIISRVESETTVQELEKNIEDITIHTQQDEELKQIEDTTQKIRTGMIAKYEENGRKYKISVLGDINGDGILNQIDLTRNIREYVQSEKWKIEKEIERISADVTCDGSIDKKDISSMIEYILYGNLEIKEVEQVKAPKIEVISGEEVEEIEEGRYVSGVTVKITRQNEVTKTAKTIYKVIGSKVIEEKEIDKEEIIELSEPGVYRIISYTYGIDGNKTKGTAIIVIDNGPEIKIKPATWTNGKVMVAIEGKETYGVQYKIDDNEWKEYEGEFEVEENCQVTARMTKGEQYGVNTEKKITNIDKEKPKGKIEVTGRGTSKIELTVEGQDEKLSGIKELRVYVKQKDSEEEYKCQKYTYEEDEQRHDKKIETLLIEGLRAEEEYEIYLEVEDIAGNIFNEGNTEADETTSLTETTKELATPIILTTPTGWTNKNVTVKIEGEEGYRTEYKLNDGNWITYEEEFEVDRNCVVKARLIEKENEENISQEITKEVVSIDKLKPTISKFQTDSIKTNSIQVIIEANDTQETQEYACSGIAEAGYKFRISNGNITNESEYQASKTFTFKGLIHGTDYTIEVEVKDNSGNIKTEAKTIRTLNQYTINLDAQNATSTNHSKTVYESYATGIYLDTEETKEITKSTNPITVPSKSYTLTYNANGGSVSGSGATAKYTFGGYYTGPNGSGIQMISSSGYLTDSFTNTYYSNNATLYEKWTGGTVTLPTPTRAGYTFDGWYTAASEGNRVGGGGTSYTPTATLTIYAHWTPIDYSISYTLDGGSVSGNPTSYTVKTNDITLNNPTKTGYDFAGWTGSNGSTPQKSITIKEGSTGDKTYTANWEPISYSIDYELNGGVNHSDNPTTYRIMDRSDFITRTI